MHITGRWHIAYDDSPCFFQSSHCARKCSSSRCHNHVEFAAYTVNVSKHAQTISLFSSRSHVFILPLIVREASDTGDTSRFRSDRNRQREASRLSLTRTCYWIIADSESTPRLYFEATYPVIHTSQVILRIRARVVEVTGIAGQPDSRRVDDEGRRKQRDVRRRRAHKAIKCEGDQFRQQNKTIAKTPLLLKQRPCHCQVCQRTDTLPGRGE